MADISQDGKVTEIWFSPDLSDYTPTNLKAKSDGKKVFLSWDHVLVNGVINPKLRFYRVYHSEDGSTYHPVTNLPTSFPRALSVFPDLDTGTHYFKVSSVFKDGYESPLSAAVDVVHHEDYGT